jgi:hypothetical protein
MRPSLVSAFGAPHASEAGASAKGKDKDDPEQGHISHSSSRAMAEGWQSPVFWRRLRMGCWRVQGAPSFDLFINAIVIINAIFLGLQWCALARRLHACK